MRIFITGTAGFIGFHLAKRLNELGFDIIGLDNFNDYYNPQLKRDRAAILKENGIETIESDICNYDLLYREIKSFRPSHIVHLAAQAGVRYSLINPQSYLRSNFHGFLNVLEVCHQMPKVKLIYASSSSVYGEGEKMPFSPEDKTDMPTNLYAASKKSNELMAFSYHSLYNIPMIGLRFFTVYGPWGRPDMAYFSFAKNILEGKPIKMFNAGEMERDFTYIDDVVDGIIASLDCKEKNEIFNLGNNKPEKLIHLVEIIENSLGKRAKKELIEMQPGEVKKTYADIEKSQKILGFNPKTSLEEGIPKFTEWLQAYPTFSESIPNLS